MKTFFVVIGLVFCGKGFSQAIDITKQWRLNIGDSSDWRNPSYNDGHWKMVDDINRFEARGLHDFHDFGWARKKVIFPSSMKAAAQKAGFFYLSLGRIYDADQVYFNGKLDGESGGMPPADKLVNRKKRIYMVPADGILWDKENVIAVRVFSNFHNGGLQGDPCTIIVPSENVFHLTRNAISSFPLEENKEAYEALVTIDAAQKKQAEKDSGLLMKIELPKDAPIFYNGKLIGITNEAGQQSFFVPASFISKDINDKLTVYIEKIDNTANPIVLSSAVFSPISGNHFNLMQVSDLKIKKGSLNGSVPVTASVKILNTTNKDFDGKLTLSLVTDIGNVQQTSSKAVHLNKLQNKEVEFMLTPKFSGPYELNYVLQNEIGEKITGTLAKGDK